MKILWYMAVGVFWVLGFASFISFVQSRHLGLLLAAIVFGTAAGTAMELGSWWPLLVGLVLAWVLRLLGADPGHR